ncbi:MAG: GNAT family N-acetyltransferase [Nocardioidaceae bacterium]
MLGPRKPGASVCWCLSHRLDAKTNRELVGPARGEYVKSICSRVVSPGVLAYEGGVEVIGWAAVAPRSELPFARSTKIPHVDELPVWSVWCIRARPGHRGKGISHALLEGAAAYAWWSMRTPAIEGYPVDNKGKRVDLTMAYVGTRRLFEDAGFTKAADTDSVSGGIPRVVMRLYLALTHLTGQTAISRLPLGWAGGASRRDLVVGGGRWSGGGGAEAQRLDRDEPFGADRQGSGW